MMKVVFFVGFLLLTSLFSQEMLTLKGGSFKMGSTSGSADEKPVHLVVLSPYKIDKSEVTNGQYDA